MTIVNFSVLASNGCDAPVFWNKVREVRSWYKESSEVLSLGTSGQSEPKLTWFEQRELFPLGTSEGMCWGLAAKWPAVFSSLPYCYFLRLLYYKIMLLVNCNPKSLWIIKKGTNNSKLEIKHFLFEHFTTPLGSTRTSRARTNKILGPNWAMCYRCILNSCLRSAGEVYISGREQSGHQSRLPVPQPDIQ